MINIVNVVTIFLITEKGKIDTTYMKNQLLMIGVIIVNWGKSVHFLFNKLY